MLAGTHCTQLEFTRAVEPQVRGFKFCHVTIIADDSLQV